MLLVKRDEISLRNSSLIRNLRHQFQLEKRIEESSYEGKDLSADAFFGLVLRSLISQRLVLLTIARRKKVEISYCLCACYLLFDPKRLPRRLHLQESIFFT